MYITNDQMAHMRAAVAPIYMDTCQRLVYTEPDSDPSYNNPTYPEGASLACLFVAKPKPDVLPGTDALQIDADLYLPRTSTLLPNDRVMITHLHGDAVAEPQTYTITAGPIVDSVTMSCGLTLVTA